MYLSKATSLPLLSLKERSWNVVSLDGMVLREEKEAALKRLLYLVPAAAAPAMTAAMQLCRSTRALVIIGNGASTTNSLDLDTVRPLYDHEVVKRRSMVECITIVSCYTFVRSYTVLSLLYSSPFVIAGVVMKARLQRTDSLNGATWPKTLKPCTIAAIINL